MKPKRPIKPKSLPPAKPGGGGPSRGVAGGREATFREVVGMIQDARGRALRAVNTELVELYWQVGGFISGKIETAAWGEGVVEELARFITRQHPDIKGFTRRSLFRMRQFFETYRGEPIVAPLVTLLHPAAGSVFKDSYLLDFLDLPEGHSEDDLQRG